VELSPFNSRHDGQVRRERRAVFEKWSFPMFDRRLVTDVALAALIAFPAVLPASHNMRSAIVQSAPPAPAAQMAYGRDDLRSVLRNS
jgi:hypothetical protein